MDVIVRRLEDETRPGGANIKTTKFRLNVLKDNELLLRAILKRFYQFEKILESMLGSSRKALRCLKKRFTNDDDCHQQLLDRSLTDSDYDSFSVEGKFDRLFLDFIIII